MLRHIPGRVDIQVAEQLREQCFILLKVGFYPSHLHKRNDRVVDQALISHRHSNHSESLFIYGQRHPLPGPMREQAREEITAESKLQTFQRTVIDAMPQGQELLHELHPSETDAPTHCGRLFTNHGGWTFEKFSRENPVCFRL